MQLARANGQARAWPDCHCLSDVPLLGLWSREGFSKFCLFKSSRPSRAPFFNDDPVLEEALQEHTAAYFYPGQALAERAQRDHERSAVANQFRIPTFCFQLMEAEDDWIHRRRAAS